MFVLVDDEAELIVAPVEPVSKKLSTAAAVLVEPRQKVAEKTAKKRKSQKQSKEHQTRSKAKASNDGNNFRLASFFFSILISSPIDFSGLTEELTEKRYRF